MCWKRPPRLAASLSLSLSLSVIGGCTGSGAAAGDDAGGERSDGGEADLSLAGGNPPPVRSCRTVIAYKPTMGVKKVVVAGEWNGFATNGLELVKQPDGTFRADVGLEPGEYAYKFIVDGNWILDTANPYRKYSGGIENSDLRVDDCHAPLLTLTAWKVDVVRGAVDGTVVAQDGADGQGIDWSTLSVRIDGRQSAPQYDAPAQRITLQATGLAEGKHTLRVTVKDKGRRAAKELYLPLWIEPSPWSWRDALIYFVMVDRFQNGRDGNDRPLDNVDPRANFQGGDWAGLKQKIDDLYFDALGVNAIWISGPNLQPDHSGMGGDGRPYSGYHGYWPVGSTEPDPRFGTMEELRAAVDAAHAHGIRILIDFVANHVHLDHPWWKDKGNTPFFNPLSKPGGGRCLCGNGCSWDPPEGIACWFNDYLPDLNYTDHHAVVAIADLAMYWLKESGADGLRLDALKHMPHIVGTTLRARLHDELEVTGVATYMVGETYTFSWDDNPQNTGNAQHLIAQYVSPGELHGQFDFPLRWAMKDVFADDKSFRQLDHVLSSTFTFYGPDAIMSPFFGNHDLPRFISEANHDPVGQEDGYRNPPGPPQGDLPYKKLRLAITNVLTIPGAPLLYYGDEIGMPGAADPDNRRMMRFDDLSPNEQAVLSTARKVGRARQSDEALRRGDYMTIWVDDAGLLVYARHVPGKPASIVALNKSDDTQQQSVPIPARLEVPEGTRYTDALGGPELVAQSARFPVSVPPRSSALYLPK